MLPLVSMDGRASLACKTEAGQPACFSGQRQVASPLNATLSAGALPAVPG